MAVDESPPDPLAQLSRHDDGRYTLRLLSLSLRTLTVEGVTLELLGAVTAIVSGPSGPLRKPVVQLRLSRGEQTLSLTLEPQAILEAAGCRVRLDYLLDGELPGLARQAAAHLSLWP